MRITRTTDVAMLVGLGRQQEEACRTALGDTTPVMSVHDVGQARNLLPCLPIRLVVVSASLRDPERRVMAEAASACDTRVVWIPDNASEVAIERLVQSAASSLRAEPATSSSRPPAAPRRESNKPANPFAALRSLREVR
jgi:hypothetical protein